VETGFTLSEDVALRRIFARAMQEVAGDLRKLHNQKLPNAYIIFSNSY
jgi:hypothetical protein